MYKQAITDISALFKQHFADFKAAVDILPDESHDALLIFNTHDISNGDYEQLTADKMEFVDLSSEGHTGYTTWLPLSVRVDLKNENAFPETQDGKYQAQSIIVRKGYGLMVGGNNRWFSVSPPLWERVQHLLPDNFELSGRCAFNFWEAYWREAINYLAENAILAIRRKPELLCRLRERTPYLLDHPGIKNELVEAFRQGRITEPKSTRGQKHQITQNIFELYHFVYFYRYQGMTLEEACAQAVDINKYLVPDDWGEPDETLRKRITRMDKYPRISQNAAFKEDKSKKGQENQ